MLNISKLSMVTYQTRRVWKQICESLMIRLYILQQSYHLVAYKSELKTNESQFFRNAAADSSFENYCPKAFHVLVRQLQFMEIG